MFRTNILKLGGFLRFLLLLLQLLVPLLIQRVLLSMGVQPARPSPVPPHPFALSNFCLTSASATTATPDVTPQHSTDSTNSTTNLVKPGEVELHHLLALQIKGTRDQKQLPREVGDPEGRLITVMLCFS